MNGKVDGLGRCNLRCKTAVELGHLAARVLKKPHISSFGLAKLAREVGIHNSLASGFNGYAPSWSARAFSNEQIKLYGSAFYFGFRFICMYMISGYIDVKYDNSLEPTHF